MKAVEHIVKIAFLGSLVWRGDRGAVDGFVQDRVVRIVLLHGAEIVGAFEQMRALAAGVLCAYGLAVDALCRETLYDLIMDRERHGLLAGCGVGGGGDGKRRRWKWSGW